MFAYVDADRHARFFALAGLAPLADIDAEAGPALRIRAPVPGLKGEFRCGGLVISMARAQRARLNGTVAVDDGGLTLRAVETFTLCRKYIAPSVAIDETALSGPASRTPLPLTDPMIAALVARADTAFLATLAPDGAPDVAHRGGPPGFLRLDAAAGSLSWPEYVGDGVFKSAGNLRATGSFTLLVPDFETGDGIELCGRGDYVNVRAGRTPRSDALVQHREPFPVQGTVAGVLSRATRLHRLLHPRRPTVRAPRIKYRNTVQEQAPRE